MAEAFDDALHEHLKEQDQENNCKECGTPCVKEFCSKTCFKANQI